MHILRRAIPPLLAVSGVALMLSACTASAPVAGEGATKPEGSGTCVAENVQWAVGQEATQATMGRVWRESGAGLIRPIGPKQAVRMDYRRDRVNVKLDAENIITEVTCG
ncbi:I78 family peptidase inhibitor [Pseudoxanthomonas putridarboris]|uniref:I78 family peptidase inhibitor n=1 Tax=Pseudoxanthomonas putridarboris TaxID=752605 RepID=A0ABU9IYE3_9GAMM